MPALIYEHVDTHEEIHNIHKSVKVSEIEACVGDIQHTYISIEISGMLIQCSVRNRSNQRVSLGDDNSNVIKTTTFTTTIKCEHPIREKCVQLYINGGIKKTEELHGYPSYEYYIAVHDACTGHEDFKIYKGGYPYEMGQ